MVECALDDAFLVVEEVLKVVHSRFGEDGKREVDENTLFAEAEEKLYGGHNTNEVIQILASSFINKIRNKSNCSSSQYNSNSNPSQLPASISLSAVSKSIATAVSEQNKKKHIQHVSGAYISNHIQNMVSKKLDQSVITKNINRKTNEKPIYSNESLIATNVYKKKNENPMKSSISAHIHKVVQEKVRNQETFNAIQKASNQQPSSSYVIHKKNHHSNKRINEAVEVTSRSIENPKLPMVIDITEFESKIWKKNQQIRSPELDNSIEVVSTEFDNSVELVSTLQSENKKSSELDNSIEVVSTLQSESTIKLKKYCLIENMDDDQFIILICRLFSHVDREEFSQMVRKFNKSYNKVMILQTFISKSEEESMTVPEEAYRYLSRINSNKRRSETEMENGLRKCPKLESMKAPEEANRYLSSINSKKRRSETEKENGLRKFPKLEKASISINFNNSKIGSSLVNASLCNNVFLKETHNEKQSKLSEKLNKSIIPSKAPYPNCSSEVKINSLDLNKSTNKNANIRKTFIEEKTQFLCTILQNTNREIMRKQVEKCHTDEHVEMLLNELLEKEKISSNNKLMHTSNLNSSRTLIKASTSTFQTISSNNKNPLELENNSNPVFSKALSKHKTDKTHGVVHQAASSGSSISKNIEEVNYTKNKSEDCLQRKSIIDNQVTQLKEIFSDADPLYLFKWCSTIKGDQEKLLHLVDEMLDKRDYPKIKKENEIITEPDTSKISKEIIEKQQRIEHSPQTNLLLSNHSQHFRKRRVRNEPQNLECMKHIIFVDLDNWHSFFQKLMRPLPDLTFVWGFHGGASQWKEPIRCQHFTSWKAKKLFHLQEKCSNRKDAADFALVLKVGRMDERLPLEIAFTVLSGDAGFYEVELQMRECERRVVVINPHHKAPAELQMLLESVGEA